MNPIRVRRIVNRVLLLVLVGSVAYSIAQARDFFRAPGSDFFAFWLAPHMLTHGISPYDSEAWRTGHIAHGGLHTSTASNRGCVYPLPLAVLNLPYGFMSLEWAAVLSTAISILALLSSVHLLLELGKKSSPRVGLLKLPFVAPVLVGVFLFRPVMTTIYLGQLDALILLTISGAVWLWSRGCWFAGGFLLAFSALRSNIGVPLIGLLGLWLMIHRRWRGCCGIASAAAFLIALGCAFDMNWIGHWSGALGGFMGRYMISTPTVWGVTAIGVGFNSSLSQTTALCVITALISCLIVFLSRIKEDKPQLAAGITIPVVLMVVPYLWVYSQIILLVPLLLMWRWLLTTDAPYVFKAGSLIFFDLLVTLPWFASSWAGTTIGTFLVPNCVLITFGLYVYLLDQRGNEWVTRNESPLPS